MIFSSKLIFVFLLIFNIVQTEPGDLISFNQRNSFSVETIDLLLENFGPIAPSALYPIEVYDIEYESYNFDGSIDTLSGLVCIPQEPTKSFPIAVYNHGTIILDTQAPSITGLSVENFEILLAIILIKNFDLNFLWFSNKSKKSPWCSIIIFIFLS